MLQRFFALSDVGTRNVRSSITLGVIINLFLMAPLGLALYVLQYFLARIMQQGFETPNVWAVSAALLAFLDWRMTIALFICAVAGFFIIIACRRFSERKMKGVIVRKDAIYDSFQ